MADKRTFDVGHEQKYAVRVPTVDEIRKANAIRATAFNEALGRGDLLRDQLEIELRNRKLWNDKREQQYQTLRQEVLDGEYQLQKGGIRLTQAKDIALDMTQKRDEMVDLLSSRTDLDSNTCEGKADAARFNYLFACCLVYDETGEPYFPRNIDDYLLNQDDPVAVAGASEFYYLISGNESIDESLPENKFLKKFNFVDEKLRLVDKEGKLITEDGRHIDEDGNFVKWEKDGTCTKVDPVGRAVNAAGDFDIEHTPFLDEDNNIIDESIYEPKKETTKSKPKRGRKKATTQTIKPKASTETSEEVAVESKN